MEAKNTGKSEARSDENFHLSIFLRKKLIYNILKLIHSNSQALVFF